VLTSIQKFIEYFQEKTVKVYNRDKLNKEIAASNQNHQLAQAQVGVPIAR